MAHDKNTDKLVKIGVEYHPKLAAIAAHQKRTMRAALEVLIEENWQAIGSPVEGPENNNG